MEKDFKVVDFSCGYARGEAIVHGASAYFCAGEVTAIVGPNGAGKSTLLKGLAGLVPWAEGDVVLCGRRIGDMSRREVSQRVALMGSTTAKQGSTVAEYVLLGRTPYRGLLSISDSATDRHIATEALETVGLLSAQSTPLAQLSDGQRQLASLARALVQEPSLLLLDEPTSNLDPRNAVLVQGAVKRLARERGLAVVAVMHDVNAARRWADRAVVMKEGRVLCSGEAQSVLNAESLSAAYGVGFEAGEAFFASTEGA